MMTIKLEQELLDLLSRSDTPTVCNAIEIIEGKRGYPHFTRNTMLITDPGAIMFGFARTARFRASRESEHPPAQVKQTRMDYYRYMFDSTHPALCVIQDLDYPKSVGAFWGEMNSSIHKHFGISGTLTDGIVRDLGNIAPNYPILAGSIGPSSCHGHVVDLDIPVEVMGLAIAPGDLIHADRHGAVKIPTEVIPELVRGIDKLIAAEKHVLNAVKMEESKDFSRFQRGWEAYLKGRS